MNHIESLKKKGYDIKLGKRGLRIPKNIPPELRKKIEAKRDVIIAELLFAETSPLITALREKRKTACEKCGEEIDLIPYPDGDGWHWFECSTCGECSTVKIGDMTITGLKIMHTGKSLLKCDYGEYWVVRDKSVEVYDGCPVFTLAELYLICGDTADKKKLLFDVKVKFGGEIMPGDKTFKAVA